MPISLNSELRGVLPTWLICALIPLPAIICWRFLGGEPVAHFVFFVCCMSLAASRFRPRVLSQQPPHSWPIEDAGTRCGIDFCVYCLFPVLARTCRRAGPCHSVHRFSGSYPFVVHCALRHFDYSQAGSGGHTVCFLGWLHEDDCGHPCQSCLWLELRSSRIALDRPEPDALGFLGRHGDSFGLVFYRGSD